MGEFPDDSSSKLPLPASKVSVKRTSECATTQPQQPRKALTKNGEKREELKRSGLWIMIKKQILFPTKAAGMPSDTGHFGEGGALREWGGGAGWIPI